MGRHAKSERELQLKKVSKLAEMGFDAKKCEAALVKANWNEEKALEALMADA
jgi:hypothetical protein